MAAISIICPNRNLPEWQELKKAIGEDVGMLAFIRNGNEIPTPQRAREILGIKEEAPAVAPKPVVEAKPKSSLEILNTAAEVKVTAPVGATSVRITDKNGKSSVQPISNFNKGANPARGADIVKIEAGHIGTAGPNRGKFLVDKGTVGVTQRETKETKFSLQRRVGVEESLRKYGDTREKQAANLVHKIVRGALFQQTGNTDYERHDSVSPYSLTTESGADSARAFEGLFGKRIVFYKDNISGAAVGGLAYAGEPDVIFLNIEDPHPWLSAAAHELLHQLRFQRPDLYDAIFSELKDELTRAWPRMVKEYGKGYTKEEIPEEAIADFFGDQITEPAFWERFSKRNPSLFERVVSAIMDWLKQGIGRLTEFKYGASRFFKDISRARDVIADVMARYAEERKQSPGEETKFSFQRGEGATTVAMGEERDIGGREFLTDESKAASIAHAKQLLDAAGVKADLVTEADPRQRGREIQWWKFDNSFESNVEGKKLVDLLKQDLSRQNQAGKSPDWVVSLVNSVRINLNRGILTTMFNTDVRRQLDALTQGEASYRGAMLGALAAHTVELRQVAHDPELHLQRTYAEAFGGDEYDQLLQQVIEHYRQYFTPEELEQAGKDFPKLAEVFARIESLNRADEGGRVYRKTQWLLKPKQAKKLKKLEQDARIEEAVQKIIEEAARSGIQPKKSPTKPLTALQKLLLMVNEQNAQKINNLVSQAVKDAEHNAGVKAALNEAKGDAEMINDLNQRFADGEEPEPEMIEKGLALPEFAHWKVIRDNLLGYSPTTTGLVQQVIRGDFKGTKFGKPKEPVVDTRINLNELAKNPDTEIQRVLDAYTANVEKHVAAAGATDETRQRIRQMIQRDVLQQIELARQRLREPMFQPPKDAKTPLTPDQKMAQLINEKLFSDPRLDMMNMVERVASKGAVAKLTPTVAQLAQQILNNPTFKRNEMRDRFVNSLIERLGISEADADAAWQVFDTAYGKRMIEARKKAYQKAVTQLTPKQLEVMPRNDGRLWKKIEQFFNAGGDNVADLLNEVAKVRGFTPPSPADIARMKALADEEQRLRTLPTEAENNIRSNPKLTDAQKDEQVAAETRKREAATEFQRAELIRQMAVMWSRMTKPINFPGITPESWAKWWVTRGNLVDATMEYVTHNVLFKIGFEAGRLGIHIFSGQHLFFLPTRVAAQIDLEFRKAPVRNLSTFWQVAHREMANAYRSTLAGFRPALLTFTAGLRGRRNLDKADIDRMMSSVNAMQRILTTADELAARGDYARAALAFFFGIPNQVGLYLNAMDGAQQVLVEYPEMLQNITSAMREMGKSGAEIKTISDDIIKMMRDQYDSATAEAAQMFDEMGIPLDGKLGKLSLYETASQIVRRRVYEYMQRQGLPADDLEAQNVLLKRAQSWKEGVQHGPGGIAAGIMNMGRQAARHIGLPFPSMVLANAIGTGINYQLFYTPLWWMSDLGKGHSPFFATPKDRRQRNYMAILGTMLGGLLIYYIMHRDQQGKRAATVRKWPRDKRESQEWAAQGRKAMTIEFNNDDGSFTSVSLLVGPFANLAPYAFAAQALVALQDKQAQKQQVLNEQAAKLGVAPGTVEPPDAADWLGVAGEAAMGTLMGNRTFSGMLASGTTYGIPNVTKLASANISGLVPGLPGYQEFTRMEGIQIDPKLATVGDFLVPLPTSRARMVNVLGDPVKTPDDTQRVLQVMTGGTYPFPVTPNEIAESQPAYTALYGTGYRPPSINPSKGYNIGGVYRPMTEGELEQYTVLRGQYLKASLSQIGASATPQAVKAAYQDANSRALADVGVAIAPRGGGQTSPRTPAAAPSPTHAGRLRRIGGLRGARSIRLGHGLIRGGGGRRVGYSLRRKMAIPVRRGRSIRSRTPTMRRRMPRF